MADDTLRMRAQVVDEFSSPLRKLKSELASVKPPADLARIRDGLKGLEQHSLAAGQAIRNGVGAALSGIGISAIGVTAAIGGAAAALKNFATGTAELRHFSVEIGLSVNRLRELQALGQRFGVDENSMLGGLKKFSNELFDIRRRRGAAYEELLKAGPGGAELAERLVGSKSVEEAVGRALGFLERIPNAVQRQRLAETLFGNGMFGRLGEGGPGSIGKLLAEIGKTIGQTSAQGVEAAKQFEEQFAKLRETLQGIQNEVGAKLLPQLNDGLGQVAARLREVDWKTFGDGASVVLREIVAFARDLAGLFKEIKDLLKGDLSPIFGENAYKGPAGKYLPTPGAGTPGYNAREAALEAKRAELEKRVEAYRQRGDRPSEIGAQTKLDQIVEELRKLREGAERGATVQQQSFGGGTGFGGLIQRASLGGGGGGGGGGFSAGAPMYRPPAGMAPERNAPMIGGGAVSPRGGGGARGGRSGGAGEGPVASDGSIPAEGRALLDVIASSESGGKNAYRKMYGGGLFDSFADHPRIRHLIRSGPNAGRTSSAAGRYQFLSGTWDRMAKKLGLPDFSPASQDKAAWQLAAEAYRRNTGGDLSAALKSRDPAVLAGVGRALRGEWTSLPGGIEQGQGTSAFLSRYNMALTRQRALADASPSSNGSARIGDDLMRRNFPTQKVEGSASLRIELDGFPRGTKATPDASGMFKKIELDRGRQMSGIDV